MSSSYLAERGDRGEHPTCGKKADEIFKNGFDVHSRLFSGGNPGLQLFDFGGGQLAAVGVKNLR